MSRPRVLSAATEPFKAGDSLDNPVTGERATMIKTPWEGEDPSLVVELVLQPGGAVAGEHIHHDFDEQFTVEAGRIAFRLDGTESVAEPGDVVDIPRGSWHDWWNESDTEEEAAARVVVSDGARFLLMLETIFGLARDGHTNQKGLPDPLQLAMFATEFRDVLVLKRPPAAIQSVLFGALKPIAKARGYRGTYPQYGRSLLRTSAR